MALPTLTSGSARLVEKEGRHEVLQSTDVETEVQAVREFIQGALKPLIGWPINEAAMAIRQAMEDLKQRSEILPGLAEDFEIKVVNDQITIIPKTEHGLHLLEEFGKYSVVSQIHES